MDQCLHGIDEAGHARGRFQVAHVCLHCAKGAKALGGRPGLKGPCQSGEFNGIAQGRSRPVRLEVGDRLRVNARE